MNMSAADVSGMQLSSECLAYTLSNNAWLNQECTPTPVVPKHVESCWRAAETL